MLDNLYIPFEEFDALYIDVCVDANSHELHDFILAAQKAILRRYVKDKDIQEKSDEEQSEYFVKSILPLGNVQTVYQMLIEDFHQDRNIENMRNVIDNELESLFSEDSFKKMTDDLNREFNSLDHDKLKDLLSVFAGANNLNG